MDSFLDQPRMPTNSHYKVFWDVLYDFKLGENILSPAIYI